MKTNITISEIKNAIVAINILKSHNQYKDANRVFNGLVERLFNDIGYDEYTYRRYDIVFGIEEANKEYYSLAFIECGEEYAVIPTTLLTHQAARYLLAWRGLERRERFEHNRTTTHAPLLQEEADIIKSAEEAINLNPIKFTPILCKRIREFLWENAPDSGELTCSWGVAIDQDSLELRIVDKDTADDYSYSETITYLVKGSSFWEGWWDRKEEFLEHCKVLLPGNWGEMEDFDKESFILKNTTLEEREFFNNAYLEEAIEYVIQLNKNQTLNC